MALHPIKVDAAGGEYMDAVVVTEWRCAPGDRVARGDVVVVVETAKAATEVEAEIDGWLADIAVAPGEEAKVGAALGHIADEAAEVEAAVDAAGLKPSAAAAPATPSDGGEPGAGGGRAEGRPVASPLARRLARARGIALQGLAGTGPHGRIKARDVEAAEARSSAAAGQRAPEARQTDEPRSPGESWRRDGVRPAAVPGTRDGAEPVPAPHAVTASAGASTPLVLLHGFAADGAIWRGARALVPATIPTIALDLPGHGKETAIEALTMDALADQLSARLDAMGIDEIHLAGHSLGGAAALALAARGRQVVRSLTLFAPAGLGAEVNVAFLHGLLDSGTPEALSAWLPEMVATPGRLPRGFAAASVAAMGGPANREVVRRMVCSLLPGGRPAFDLRAALAETAVPLRIVWGAADRVVAPPDLSALPPHAAFHRLAGVGHVPPVEAPALTARLLTETVRSAS